ncbi:MAG: M15 family metallopeptidase [Armatimonadota bacterium]|nr:M15 family metallopeptidase [Armatimonadota bacterium]
MPGDIHRCHPAFAPRVIAWLRRCRDEGLRVWIVSSYRDMETQRALYLRWLRRGRTGLPAAPPGRSLHNYGLAVDYAAASGAERDEAGLLAEQMGLRWGGRFMQRDPVHVDIGYDLTRAREEWARQPELVAIPSSSDAAPDAPDSRPTA